MTYKQEQIKPYNDNEEKGAQVELMFDNIAQTYDKLNHRLSWNIDKIWRHKALKRLKPFKPQTMLDIATGTGDFAIQAAKMRRYDECRSNKDQETWARQHHIIQQGRLYGIVFS